MAEGKKSKIKIFVILLIVLVLILAISGGAYFYYRYNLNEIDKEIEEISSKNNEALIELNEKAEYGYEVSYDELLNELVNLENLQENTDIKIFINDEEIVQDETYKFDTVGTFKIRVSLSYVYNYTIITEISKTIENEKESKITVEDTIMPVLSGIEDKVITVGDEINLLEGITAQDEVDGELDVAIVEGSVDNTKAGEYTIKVSATDKNGNVTEAEFKVTVKEKTEVATGTNSSTSNKSNSSSNKTNSSTSSSSSSSSGSNSSSSSSSAGNSSSSSSESTAAGRLALAKAEAKRVVSQIIKPGMTNYQKANAICMYITNTVDRQTNQSSEAYKTNYGNEAYAALVMKIAACSGRCKAVTLLCDAAGLKSQHINPNSWTHQWNKIQMEDGSWIVIDAQIGFIGDTHPLE